MGEQRLGKVGQGDHERTYELHGDEPGQIDSTVQVSNAADTQEQVARMAVTMCLPGMQEAKEAIVGVEHEGHAVVG